MVKKALQIAVSLSLLIGGYAGYIRLFAIATTLLGDGRSGEMAPFPVIDSTSAQKANQLALESFGADHFAASKELKLQYYEASRGYYMYAQNYEQLDDNKRIHVWPFALISVSGDGKSRKLVTSNEAVIDMSQPFGMGGSKAGAEPSHVVHARLIGDVRIRDDKGTREDPTDDLRVAFTNPVDYDDKTLQITSDSEIILEDRDLRLTGIGMMIQLRRKTGPSQQGAGDGGSGFDTETAYVYNDVHIIVNNVTSNGILPGTAKPEKSGRTPLDLRCDREMKIQFPPPRAPVLIGPPDLDRVPDPTLAFFKTNVRVIRGTDKTDQLNCDTLDLTLMPNPKPPVADGDESEEEAAPALVATVTAPPSKDGATPPDGEKPPVTASGPLTDLKLRKAKALGDAVWLQSEASGLVARCQELHYEKHSEEGKPDITYLNGGRTRKIWVEKVDFDTQSPTPGAIKSIIRMDPRDATIFDFGPGGTSKVLALGPGKMEERPARNASVTRTAWFEDEMEMLTWRDGEGTMPPASVLAIEALQTPRPPILKGTLRRLVTLKGDPKLVDHKSATTLDARKSIIAEFQAVPKVVPVGKDGPMLVKSADPSAAPAAQKVPDGPTEIKWLDANVDAHLTAPSRTLTARRFLKAKFETAPPPPPVAAGPAPAPGPVVASASAPDPASTPDGTQPEPAPAPVEPAVDGRADRVWASVLLGSSGTKGELKNAQLRGDVLVHQDPEPGKPLGKDASGQALDLISQGNGQMWFAVKREEPPQARDAQTRLASNGKTRPIPHAAFARVEFEGKIIESEDLIILDQKLDYATAHGAGIFIQMADRGLLDDKGIEGERVQVQGSTRSVGPNPKDRLVITWNEEMRFFGKSKDLANRPAAKIEFRGASKEVWTPQGRPEFRRGVEAHMTESLILCDTMDVYLDRTINLTKETRKPAPTPNADGPASGEAQIAMLDCRGDNVVDPGGFLKWPGVDVVNEKKYPDNGEFKEKQRIQSQHVIYDKRTGEFEAPGAGTTWLYKRKGGEPKPEPVRATAASSNGRNPADAKVVKLKMPPIELTKVTYTDYMRGRFGVAKDSVVDNQNREAQFIGSAEAANAIVATSNSDIDFDGKHRQDDYMFLTSDDLHVYSVPPPINSKDSARQLLNARGNAAASTVDSQIQADLITYDSATELIYAYGQDGKEVSLVKQDSPGQPASGGKGKTLLFNKKTHQSKLDDPNVIQFADLKSGLRSKPLYPELGGSPKKPEIPKTPRMPFQKPSRGSTERKSFTGGT